MPLNDRALTTLSNAKSYLGITGDAEDTLLTSLINSVSSWIETYCDRIFKRSSYVEVVRGSGHVSQMLKAYPIIGSVVLEENTSGDATDSWNTINTDRYFTFNDEGYLEMVGGSIFTKRPRAYRATYEAGYRLQGSAVTGENVALPNDLELACWRLLAGIYNQRKAEGTSNQNLGDYSVGFNKLVEDDPSLKQTLLSYRRPAL